MKRKKQLIMSLVISSLMVSSFIPTVTAKADTGWNLAWSDEFNGTNINTSNWKYETGGDGWGNNELEYYTNRSENARIENGNLVIEARKENYNGMNYTSARLKSQGLKNWTYGKVEARMKLPAGQGVWPAFWMLGENISQVSWPKCGEIDIMEHINNESAIHGTIHWDSTGNNTHAQYGAASPNIDVTQYHVYSIEWDASSIKWFVDGTQYLEANIANNINGTEEFHKPFFILFNLAVGGNWPGNPDGSTPFPAKMYVDYVRVYQHGDNNPTPAPTAPAVPSGLSAAASNQSSINVSWNASSGATGYDLKVDNNVISNVTSPYVNSGLTENSTHTYAVRAKNANGTSSWSNSISATTKASSNPTTGSWAPNTAYKVGDIVSYNGKNYKCIQAHTSLVGWEPSNVPALWVLI
ncbi:family 16 glycosylhydrolase [Clostridium beijerinckii]|jgi:Beta-glucanase/Beta-glucan synthetase|uniref:Family 16 glycosylhydrolase n=2 Tax=Clostridium beijerinckii TaxID=1520 RepID=A0AAE2V384_CLOBE|nr:family 16 glycosylhydrolase [Clostridium beijerinckii]ABR34976.1 glycoside hydrolase, family 16 [Clostridium beijerinckii NCIMB 8052]AIU02374.1 glycoside hydrolase family protein [Clostridium beijerinckii ATCC 35702]MBF7810386.1 family 16 glycosylhydrolase [Clostridium beijerinckii]NRT23647.1 beta-glucanase (GH16 family) [Clostridium beijerinckii]NRT68776.1 beta-glucanase (GH16 family) [Clostridium beijerinckii]